MFGVIFHFFNAIVKFCVIFVEEIILGAIYVKYGRTSAEITKYNTPPQVILSCKIYIILVHNLTTINFMFLTNKFSINFTGFSTAR